MHLSNETAVTPDSIARYSFDTFYAHSVFDLERSINSPIKHFKVVDTLPYPTGLQHFGLPHHSRPLSSVLLLVHPDPHARLIRIHPSSSHRFLIRHLPLPFGPPFLHDPLFIHSSLTFQPF